MIEVDIRTNKHKVKLYREAGSNQLKGDGLCTYMNKESVELAITILDESNQYPELQANGLLRVQRAKFEMKGDKYDPKLKPKKLGKKEKARLEKKREKLLAWEPEKMRGERNKRDKVVVIKNVFDKVCEPLFIFIPVIITDLLNYLFILLSIISRVILMKMPVEY